jgi:hypothetical protein
MDLKSKKNLSSTIRAMGPSRKMKATRTVNPSRKMGLSRTSRVRRALLHADEDVGKVAEGKVYPFDAQPCKISDNPVSHLDLQATMLYGMGAPQSVLDTYGEYSTPIQFRDDPPDRPRYHDITTSDGKHDTSIVQYEITGDARDFSNWHLDGKKWDFTPPDDRPDDRHSH